MRCNLAKGNLVLQVFLFPKDDIVPRLYRFPGQINIDMFYSCILFERIHGEIFSKPRLFESTVRHLRSQDSVLVYPYGAEIQLIRSFYAGSYATNPKIEFIWNSVVEEVLGKEKVEGLRIKNVQNNETGEVKCDGIFIAIGHKPNTELFRGQIQTDQKGYIMVKDGSKTNAEGVFVAGDVYDYIYRQAITAAGSGCRAAIDTIRYLESKE